MFALLNGYFFDHQKVPLLDVTAGVDGKVELQPGQVHMKTVSISRKHFEVIPDFSRLFTSAARRSL